MKAKRQTKSKQRSGNAAGKGVKPGMKPVQSSAQCRKGKKPVRRGKTAAAGTGRKSLVKPKKSPFEGATELSVTENKIAIRRNTSTSGKGSYAAKTTRVYVDKTPENMRAFGAAVNGRGVKKVTVKLK